MNKELQKHIQVFKFVGDRNDPYFNGPDGFIGDYRALIMFEEPYKGSENNGTAVNSFSAKSAKDELIKKFKMKNVAKSNKPLRAASTKNYQEIL